MFLIELVELVFVSHLVITILMGCAFLADPLLLPELMANVLIQTIEFHAAVGLTELVLLCMLPGRRLICEREPDRYRYAPGPPFVLS
jgi:hypothetical protein